MYVKLCNFDVKEENMTSAILMIISFLLLLINQRQHFMDGYLCALVTLIGMVISISMTKKQYDHDKFVVHSVIVSGLYLMIVSEAFGPVPEIILKSAGIGLLICVSYFRWKRDF